MTSDGIGSGRQDMGEGLLSVQRKPYTIGMMLQSNLYSTFLSGYVLQDGSKHGFLSHLALTFTHLQGDAVPSVNIREKRK